MAARGPVAGAVRADAFAAVVADVRRAGQVPDCLKRLGQVRFGAEWARRLPGGGLTPPRTPDAARRIAELDIPVLLLHGRQDMTFPVSLVEPTLDLIPRASAVVLDDAGHMLHVDQPEGYLRAVREFLDGPAFQRGLELGSPRPV